MEEQKKRSVSKVQQFQQVVQQINEWKEIPNDWKITVLKGVDLKIIPQKVHQVYCDPLNDRMVRSLEELASEAERSKYFPATIRAMAMMPVGENLDFDRPPGSFPSSLIQFARPDGKEKEEKVFLKIQHHPEGFRIEGTLLTPGNRKCHRFQDTLITCEKYHPSLTNFTPQTSPHPFVLFFTTGTCHLDSLDSVQIFDVCNALISQIPPRRQPLPYRGTFKSFQVEKMVDKRSPKQVVKDLLFS